MSKNAHQSALREVSVELRHIETLLDVVFGVIIALPLLELPEMIREFLRNISALTAIPPLLLVAALIFTVFYWLEVRHFIAEQERFNQAIAHQPEDPGEGVPLSRAAFVLGGLFMMMLGASALVFAKDGRIRYYLAANLAFWLCDLVGTFLLHRTYIPFRKAIERVKREQWLEHRWFWGHISSRFYYYYGFSNALVFSIVLAGDYVAHASALYRAIMSLLLVIIVLLRHLVWRSKFYINWLEANYGSTVIRARSSMLYRINQ